MIVWKCLELHSHTFHSDGNFSLGELCSAAKKFLYDGIALTDHNTMSGLEELNGEGICVPVIPGIEWTTFYGHMLVIGADRYIDWRFVRPETMDEYTSEIKKAGAVIGIAHPFQMGSPMCTGCYWDFKIHDWKKIDYIEVWSEPFPLRHYKNILAFSWWTELLNEGHHLAASSGWDWHRLDPSKPLLPAATWLGLEDGIVNTSSVKSALAGGRTIVSVGPLPEFSLHCRGNSFYPGDTLGKGELEFSIAVNESLRKDIWGNFGIHTDRLSLVHNGVQVSTVSGSLTWEESISLSPGWYRLEGYGELEGKKDVPLFFTSPWYV